MTRSWKLKPPTWRRTGTGNAALLGSITRDPSTVTPWCASHSSSPVVLRDAIRDWPVRGDVEGAGGDDERAAAHEVLVRREQRLLAQVVRIDDEQHARVARDAARVEGRGLHVEVNRQELAQVLVLVAGRRRHLLLHVGVRRGRRIERHGLQESLGEPLQTLLQAALQSLRVEGLGQRRLHHGLAVRQRQVEVEGVEIEETGGHRREAVLLRDLEADRAVAGVRVDDLRGELAARGFRQFRKDPVEFTRGARPAPPGADRPPRCSR